MIELRRGVAWHDGGRFIQIERYLPDRDFQHLLEVNFIVFPRRVWELTLLLQLEGK
jgi:hypothetical protein